MRNVGVLFRFVDVCCEHCWRSISVWARSRFSARSHRWSWWNSFGASVSTPLFPGRSDENLHDLPLAFLSWYGISIFALVYVRNLDREGVAYFESRDVWSSLLPREAGVSALVADWNSCRYTLTFLTRDIFRLRLNFFSVAVWTIDFNMNQLILLEVNKRCSATHNSCLIWNYMRLDSTQNRILPFFKSSYLAPKKQGKARPSGNVFQWRNCNRWSRRLVAHRLWYSVYKCRIS